MRDGKGWFKMAPDSRRPVGRKARNVHGRRVVKFGVFLPNGSNGWVISEAVKPYTPTYEHQKAIVFEAE